MSSAALRLLHRVSLPVEHPASIAHAADGIWVADIEDGSLTLVHPEDGSTIRRVRAVVPRPQTISWDGEDLWEYDEETSDLYRRSLSAERIRLYGKVAGVKMPYLGMAYRDRTLWLISPDQPYFTVSNNEISVVKFPRRIQAATFEAPTHSCRGLCHDGRYLWTLDVEEAELFAVHPDNGTIITSYHLPGCPSPSSLVVTEDRFWTLDLATNELLTYELDRSVKQTRSGGRRSSVDIVYTFRNAGPGTINELEMAQTLPRDYVNQRVLRRPIITPEPSEVAAGQWDDGVDGEVVVHKIRNLAPGAEERITLSLDVKTVDLQWHVYPHLVGGLDEIPDEIASRYLFERMLAGGDEQLARIVATAQDLFQANDKEIRRQVEEIVDGETNPFWIAKRIYDFVVDKVQYILPYSSISTRKILKQGKGSCGNHATIYIALCEAAGLPARSIIGFGVWKRDSRLGYLDHEIPEVYLPNYGWIPADTSRFMALPIRGTHPLTKYRSFGSLSDRMFINGFGRDMTSPWARRRWSEERLTTCDGPCQPEERFFLRWESMAVETWKK